MLNLINSGDREEFSPEGYPIQKFLFGEQEVRVLLIENEPWFVLRDICNVLTITDSNTVLKRLDPESVNDTVLNCAIRKISQNHIVIDESGMYSVLLGSRKLIAKPFQKWVTKEVLPTIRKTGSYSLISEKEENLNELALAKKNLLQAQKIVELLEEKEKLEKENQLLELEKSSLENSLEQASEVIDELFDFSSIVRIAKYNNVSEKNFSWHRLKSVCLSQDLEIKKVPCPRFGEKNLYPHIAWNIAYPLAKLPENSVQITRLDQN